MTATYSHTPKAKKFLNDLYQGSTDVTEKRQILEKALGTSAISFFACGGEICDGLELACLEREVLVQKGVFRPALF